MITGIYMTVLCFAYVFVYVVYSLIYTLEKIVSQTKTTHIFIQYIQL